MKKQTGVMIGILMVALVSAAAIIATFLAARWDSNAPYSPATVFVSAVSFVGLLLLSQSDGDQWQMTESALRSTIAGSLVITYLYLVGIVALFTQGPTVLPAIAQTMITNFTTVVGVVIAFYFGASAYAQARSRTDRPAQDHNDDQKRIASQGTGSGAVPEKMG